MCRLAAVSAPLPAEPTKDPVLAAGSVERDFDHPVSRFTYAVFRRYRGLALTHPTLDDAVGGNAVGEESMPHGVAATFRETHVVGIGARTIGLAEHRDPDAAIASGRVCRRVDDQPPFRGARRLVEVEEDVVPMRRRRRK